MDDRGLRECKYHSALQVPIMSWFLTLVLNLSADRLSTNAPSVSPSTISSTRPTLSFPASTIAL